MAKRHQMGYGKSRKMFRRGASRSQSLNFSPPPMRGGIRL